MKKIILPLLFCFTLQLLPAQNKIIFEELRFGSFRNATMTYLKNEDIRKTFAGQLNALLLKHQLLPLADTVTFTMHNLNESSTPAKTSSVTRYDDTADLHMYLEIMETTPAQFFTYTGKTAADSALMSITKTVFMLRGKLEKSNKEVVFNSSLDVIVSSGLTPGMGIESNLTAMTPKGFLELLKRSFDLLLDPKNDISQVQMKVPPAFIIDNFILPKTIKQPRIYFTTTKDISAYRYDNSSQMIRLGETMYEEIRIKGKKAEKYPDALTMAIKNTSNYQASDYVFLRQDDRDVLNNKNYQLKLVTQIDPDYPFLSPEFAFTNFLSGNFHCLLNEKDTIAIFSIEKSIADPSIKIYTSSISNGFDSASVYSFLEKETIWPMVYDYVVTGKINNQDFNIKCSGFRNTIKEIYLNEKLVCIAQGRFNPEKMVVFDASLSSGLLNQIFMIAFNRFFE